ncbi:3'-5' exonuclease [Flavobacterium sp. NKUCC04_CG]|uniref:3'-5' exonuclease n=1 Tax=Flavobacterium sp. NKUCC04_CG TaxID=2842121 RepID=UPI001C5B9B9B|nr:3'-5' exonuclease [Flavobacterium sp. NKUCC04_CG]MBW3520047.1 3'-5' exonuclease [Flavobacterium sp. NKUCC04_CG]
MTDFVAIDFETANAKRSSICSLGLVIVENNIITDRLYSLIKPEPNFYTSFTTNVHGLTFQDTIQSPLFFDVWAQLLAKTKNLPFVAHNSSFDSSCLKAIYASFDVDYPNFEFYCTLKTARQKLPQLRNHQLGTVAQYFGYDLKNHHHALADAEACAVIATHLL